MNLIDLDFTANKIIKDDCGAIIGYSSSETKTEEITSTYTKSSIVCPYCKNKILIMKVH